MKILGLGNALVDILAFLKSDEYIAKMGLIKGAMELIDENRLMKIMHLFEEFDTTLTCGGSAANTICGLSSMGVETGFLGKVGSDRYGEYYHDDFLKNGVTPTLLAGELPTGRAMTLISPDGERTFGTYLGSAATMNADDLKAAMFTGYDLMHIEGYLVQDAAFIRRAVQLAKEAGLSVSLDMASFNVVNAQKSFFAELITKYTDILFANEEEAYAFTGLSPEAAAKSLSLHCPTVVVKCGENGSIICRGETCIKVEAVGGCCVDTTGAGDLYAAGFLYGISRGADLATSGAIGSEMAGHVISVVGPRMTAGQWDKIKLKVGALLSE